MPDPELDGFASEIRTALSDASIVVLEGFASERAGRVIVMPSSGASLPDVVAAISRLNPAFVTYDAQRLDQADVDAIATGFTTGAGEGEPSELHDRVAILQPHVGEVSSLSIAVVGEAKESLISFAWTASWAFAIEGSANDRQSDRLPAPAPRLSVLEVQALAREIALSPRYQSVTMTAKAHAARLVAGDRATALSEQDWWRVVSEARSIWEVEIRPERDADLRKRAVALLDEGKTKATIARDLGITPKQLTALIG